MLFIISQKVKEAEVENENSEAISQSVSVRIINELKAGGYSAIAVNTSGRENNWDTEKICVIRDGKDVCDIIAALIPFHTATG